MGSFDANGTNIDKVEAHGHIKDGASQGTANPFEHTLHETWSKPGKKVAQAADPSDILEGKSEKQYVAKAAHDARKQLGLHDNATSEDVFKKMGEDGYKNFLSAHQKEQNEALKGLGLTRENISADAMTRSMIERRRTEEKLPKGASLQDIETGMYKKFYHDVKKGTAPTDYD
jgi:hypothetical protein